VTRSAWATRDYPGGSHRNGAAMRVALVGLLFWNPVLGHRRGVGPHARGCWGPDLVPAQPEGGAVIDEAALLQAVLDAPGDDAPGWPTPARSSARLTPVAWKLAVLDGGQEAARWRAVFRAAHAERLRQEHGQPAGGQPPVTQEVSAALAALLDRPRFRGLSRQGQVHLLLSAAPLPRVGQVYQAVFERLLGERISTSPVAVNTAAR